MKKIREFLIDFYPLPQCQTAHSSGSPSALHLLSLLCGFLVTLSLKSLVQGCSGRWRLPGPAAETRGLPHSHPLRSKHRLGKKKKRGEEEFTGGDDVRGGRVWKDSDELHADLQRRQIQQPGKKETQTQKRSVRVTFQMFSFRT